jgi:hypothetical protein
MRTPRLPKKRLKTARVEKHAKRALKERLKNGARLVDGVELPPGAILANWNALQHNFAVDPDTTYPRFYANLAFQCRDCGSDEVWTARQQKWWYETAKGLLGSVAIRCRSCRRKERERAAAVREAHMAGVARKAQEGTQ